MQSDRLPANWTRKTLGEIADWGSGGTPSRSDPAHYGGIIPWIKTGDLGPKYIFEAKEYLTDSGIQNSSAKYFPKGSVAIAMYGATIGKTSILGIDATTNQACGVGLPKPNVTTSEFLYYLLCNERDNFVSKAKGGAQPNISQSMIKEHEIFLPPILEQQEITSRLNELLARANRTKKHLELISKMIRRFRQSILCAAVEGRLTAIWRGKTTYTNNGYPSTWEELGFNDVGRLSRGKSKHRPRNDPILFGDKFPFIQTGDVANSHGFISEAKYRYNEFGLAQSKLFPKGTLCITIAANIADTSILGIDACFPDSVVGFIPDTSKCEALFVKYLVDVNKTNLEDFAPATAQKNINLKILNDMRMPFPPLLEQKVIIEIVERLFRGADLIEKNIMNALDRIDNMGRSVLNNAFNGNLTAEWREVQPKSGETVNGIKDLFLTENKNQQKIDLT